MVKIKYIEKLDYNRTFHDNFPCMNRKSEKALHTERRRQSEDDARKISWTWAAQRIWAHMKKKLIEMKIEWENPRMTIYNFLNKVNVISSIFLISELNFVIFIFFNFWLFSLSSII